MKGEKFNITLVAVDQVGHSTFHKMEILERGRQIKIPTSNAKISRSVSNLPDHMMKS